MGFLTTLAKFIDRLNEAVGNVLAVVALAMVLVQFVIVVMRYVFGLGSIFMQESIVYMHAALFMVGAGYTLLHNGHVRVDIFYSSASEKRKALIDLLGVFVFLVPVCVLVWTVSWPYVANAWAVLEGSVEVSGIQAVYLLKTTLLVFAALLALQGLALAIRSLFRVLGISSDDRAEQEGPLEI